MFSKCFLGDDDFLSEYTQLLPLAPNVSNFGVDNEVLCTAKLLGGFS